jgi:hypothetical protein
MARVPALDVEEAVLDAVRKLTATVDPKRWSSLLGPRPHVVNQPIEFPSSPLRNVATPTDRSALAPAPLASHIGGALGSVTTARLSTASQSAKTPGLYRMASAPGPAMALASESHRLIKTAVERVALEDGSIKIALTRDAAEIVGETTIITAWRKPSVRVGRELILPLEASHPDARATRSDTKVKLLTAIAKARTWLDELIAGRVLDIANVAHQKKRSVRSTTMLFSLAFLAPGLVQAIAENRLPRGIGLTRLADLPSDWSEQFVKLGLRAPR